MDNYEKILAIKQYVKYLYTTVGQLNLYVQRRYNDSNYPDNIKQKIKLINELIRIVENEISNWD